MSILNDTLKSLDKRNQSEDFGLAPTVQIKSNFLSMKSLFVVVLTIVVVLVVVVFLRTKQADNEAKVNDARSQPVPPATINIAPKAPSEATDEVEFEGMIATPLSSDDLASRQSVEPVVAQVFNTVDSAATVEDDEQAFKQVDKARPKEVSVDSQPSSILSSQQNREESVVPQKVSPDTLVREKQALEVKGEDSAAIVNQSSSANITPMSALQQSNVHLQAGIEAYRFGMIDAARENFALALATNADNREARRQLAALYFGQNNSQQALRLLAEGMAIEPNNLEWRELMAKILVAEGRLGDVIAIMPEELNDQALDESRADYLIIKGTSAQATNRPKQAVSAFLAMTKLQPENGKWWLALGVNYDALNDSARASLAYTEALNKGGLSSSSAQYASERLTALQEQR